MWGLEYALLFGLPNNKLELMGGKSRCAFPFGDREEAEAHFAAWTETLCRWKGLSALPAIHKGDKTCKVEVKGFGLELFPLPIDLRIPFTGDTFMAFYRSFWRREVWGCQPTGREVGWESAQRHADVQLNLWQLFGGFCERHGGQHCGRVDIVLSDTTTVAPDQYYFDKSVAECMIEEDYFHGAPDLVAEVLSPASRQIDRGPRMALYRRAGVPHLWLLDPEMETVELFELANSAYRPAATFHAGDTFPPVLFPGSAVSVDDLFNTQWRRHQERYAPDEPEPIPQWLISPEEVLGLEHLFLLGHPERRYEIWGNRAPCVLPFGSEAEARLRFSQFVDDACRWEQAALPKTASLGPDVEQAEVGRFQLTRKGRHIHLDVAVDARKYREMLVVWARRDVWDWGES